MATVAYDLLSTVQLVKGTIWGAPKSEPMLDIDNTYEGRTLKSAVSIIASGSAPIKVNEIQHSGLECMKSIGYSVVEHYSPSYLGGLSRMRLASLQFTEKDDTNLHQTFVAALVQCQPKTHITYTQSSLLPITKSKVLEWSKVY